MAEMTVRHAFVEGMRWLVAAAKQPNSDTATRYGALATAHFAAVSAAQALHLPGDMVLPGSES
jgi:hypothetical protein